MVSLILAFILFILIGYMLYKPIYGIMCYYIIRMIIPSVARIGTFSFNTISLGILLLILLPHLGKTYRYSDKSAQKYIQAIFTIGVGLFILTFFGEIPLAYQWHSLIQMLLSEIVPSILLILYLKESNDYKTFCNIVCIMSLFTALYGIYTYITANNPIFTTLNNSGEEGYILEDYTTGRFGLTGIAVGIYNDKIALSLISFLLFIFLINKHFINKTLLTCTLILTFIDIFLTTQRTALFCIIFFFIIICLDKKNKRTRKYFKLGVILIVVLAIFGSNSIIRDSLNSIIYIFNDKMQEKLGVGGSSTNLRMLQFINGIDYLGFDWLLQGQGYNFPSYYYEYIFSGIDPRFLGFESFLLRTLMSSGIIGIIIWSIGFFKIYKSLYPIKNKYNTAFFISYLFAIIMTDTSSSFYLFFFLSVLNSKQTLLSKKY